jgi:peptidoglycan/LPS O-acetylase OafA/YrhL
VSTILLLIIALVAPWTVHLAPPRQRALALVGVVAVVLLYGIFATNPLTRWEMWAGLAAGILTVMFLAGGATAPAASEGASRPRRRRRPPRHQSDPLDGGGDEPTGEI